MTITIYLLAIFVSILCFAVRNHPNGIAGYRVEYTLTYPDIWKKVHWVAFLAGIISCIATGIAFLICSKEAMQIIVWINLAFPLFITIPVTLFLGRAKMREEEAEEERQRREAEEKEGW